MKRRLILIAALMLTMVAFMQPSTQATPPTGDDCGMWLDHCRSFSRGMYDLCIVMGQPADKCAAEEAYNTITCMAAANCPMPRTGGDN